jgi:hypothetical protein
MIEVAIILSMAASAGILAYSAFQMKDDHAQIKMLLSAVAMFFVIGTVFTGYMFALNGVSTGDVYDRFYNQTSFTNGYLSTEATTVAEAQTELGNLFIATHVERDLPADGKVYYMIETGNVDPAQTRFKLTSTGSVRMDVYEGVDRLGGTQGVVVENSKRNSPALNTYNSTWYNTTDAADIGSKGEKIEELVSPTGATVGQSTAGAVSDGAKWVFNSNTTYLIQITNLESQSIDVSLAADFYEQPVRG